MVRLTFNPFKLRTVAHYAYEYVAMHGDVVRGKFTHTKPDDAFRQGYRKAQLDGRFPLMVRVVDERGEVVDPPVVVNNPPVATFTQEQLVQALKDAQAAHHKHEEEVLEKYDEELAEELDHATRMKVAAELSNTWVEWYVAHIFKRKVADSAIEEIVGTL